jgi:hypothetical protein
MREIDTEIYCEEIKVYWKWQSELRWILNSPGKVHCGGANLTRFKY